MIDLHCHLLPNRDDGPKSFTMALAMARLALADGITTTACTPHIYQGLYDNDRAGILRGVDELAARLREADILLHLTHGADIQIIPDLVPGLQAGRLASLNDSRYFLFEPPHHIVPQTFARLIFECLAAGYVPVITHPERLIWLDEAYYEWFVDAAVDGAWLQVTADAVTGRFGSRAQYWAERFLSDGLVHVLASDAHDDVHRPPRLGDGRRAAERWVGAAEAERMVVLRPQAILANLDPRTVPPPPALAEGKVEGTDEATEEGAQWRGKEDEDERTGFLQRLSRILGRNGATKRMTRQKE